MPRTAEKVKSLLEEDEKMEDAIRTVKGVAEDNGGTVAWEDVEGEVSSGQWGRLIETGLLQSADGDGFAFQDPDRVEGILNDDDLDLDLPEVDVDDEDASWSQWDKLAGITTLAMMVGYYFDPVQNLVGSTVDLFLGPFDAVLPFYGVIMAMALLTGLYSSLLQANLMNTERIAAYQERMKAIQQKRKEAQERGDDEAVQRIQEQQMEMMGDQLGMFKEQFRPMVWITVITIPIFLWMWWMVNDPATGVAESGMIVPLAGEITWGNTIIGPIQSWIAWYFVCSLGFSQLIRKSLNIQVSPS